MSLTLAIEGGVPVREKPFPEWPVWDDTERAALSSVLGSGLWGSVTGDVVKTFEREFASFQGGEHCVAVTNGTMALVLALKACGVGPGDEVIVPPYTFIASASSVLMAGAQPVFADILPDTLILDPEQVERAIGPATKAIMCVHFAGRPCDMDTLADIAERHGLRLIEDAAQAHGARWRGLGCGAIGDLGTFSFQSSKNMTAGEGGATLTNDEALADVAWSLANVGRARGGGWYQHERVGWNMRMTEFQGALLRAQLKRVPEQMRRREESAGTLTDALKAIGELQLPPTDARITGHAWHLYAFRIPRHGLNGGKKRFATALAAEGIPCSEGYVSSLHRNRALLAEATALSPRHEYKPNPCPISDEVTETAIFIPQNVLLGERQDIEDVAKGIEKVMNSLKKEG